MSPVLWFAVLVGGAVAPVLWLLSRRPDVIAHAGNRLSAVQARAIPLTSERALRLIVRQALSVLSSPAGNTATGLTIAVSASIWEMVELGAVVDRVRGGALELDPPHPMARNLAIRPVLSRKLGDGEVMVTTLRRTSEGTRFLGATDVPGSPDGTIELVPLGEQLASFVLPPGVTLILGSEGDLVVPRPTADHYGVSRLHAALRNNEGEIEVTDLASTNGLRLNGRLVATTNTAQVGDELACGNARWTVAERQPESQPATWSNR